MTTETIDQATGAQTVEERAEVARNLRDAARQALGVENERKEWEITDASPRRKLYVLYSMIDGSEIRVPKFIFDSAISRRIPGSNKYLFTAFREQAPQHRVGEVKCFLHPESPEREVLAEIGIYGECPKANLTNLQSKRVHAQHRHKTEWEAYQEFISVQREEETREWQRQQAEAFSAMASRRGKAAE